MSEPDDHTVSAAWTEYHEWGTIQVGTYRKLQSQGIDPDVLMAQFETEEQDNGNSNSS